MVALYFMRELEHLLVKKNRRNVKSSSDTVNAHEKDKDFITEEERDLLVQAAKGSRHRWRNAAIVLLMFNHGLRVSELCGLRKSDIDLKTGRVYVRRIKGSLDTHQPMNGIELRAVKRYLKEGQELNLPWLFISERKGQLTRQAINYLLTTLSVEAKLNFKVRPHMLRHGCGYALANRGRDTRLIQDYLGHRDIKHTTRYTRTAAARFETAWD